MTKACIWHLLLAALLSASMDGSHCLADHEDPVRARARAKPLSVEQATALVERNGSLRPAVTELTAADVAAVIAMNKGDYRIPLQEGDLRHGRHGGSRPRARSS